MKNQTRINQEIKAKKLRVIGESGEQLGVLTLDDALKKSKSKKLDLVEISPNADPPVAKIINWSKYQYQKMKKDQKNRKKSKSNELKQMRFGLKIGENDLNIKLNKVKKFLEKDNTVRISIVLKGREMAHKDIAYQMMDKIIDILGDKIIVGQKPQFSGRNLSTIVRSK